jgi:hypothetical protein
MKLQLLRAVMILAALWIGVTLVPTNACAQAMDFSQIDRFESMGTGEIRGGSPPKTIIDDGERHAVFLTIWELDTEVKVNWKTLDGSPRTTVINGPGVQAFQTAGELRLEAIGDGNHSVKYGYVVLGLRK